MTDVALIAQRDLFIWYGKNRKKKPTTIKFFTFSTFHFVVKFSIYFFKIRAKFADNDERNDVEWTQWIVCFSFRCFHFYGNYTSRCSIRWLWIGFETNFTTYALTDRADCDLQVICNIFCQSVYMTRWHFLLHTSKAPWSQRLDGENYENHKLWPYSVRLVNVEIVSVSTEI